MHVVARGRVVGAPEEITVDAGKATVLLLAGTGAADEVEYQVCCRDGGLGQLVRDRVRVGDAMVIVGELAVRRVDGPIEDTLSAATVTLEAETVAVELLASGSAYS
jgi:hypothetical protein